MTKKSKPPGPSRQDPTTSHDGGSRIGYGNPPKEHQFKPGRSGNPKGRPKGSKGESTILREILERKIEVRSNGRIRKIPILEAIHLKVTEDALRGNTKSAAFILNRYAALVSGELHQDDLGDDDRAILEAFARRLAEQGNSNRSGS